MKYIVGFSGGIDSTFVAWYLKKQGHDVLLVNLKNTYEYNKCCSVPTELFKIADFLGLDLKIIDVTKDFKQFVIDNFVSSYLHGETPNPCINCNEQVRFKILNKLRQKLGYDFVATGHYVKLTTLHIAAEKGLLNSENGEIDKSKIDWNLEKKHFSNNSQKGKSIIYTFAVSQDSWKDQSYMLYRLIKFQNVLEYLRFPLGGFKKSEVKQILEKEKIPLNTSKESQNICFIPDDDYPRFIRQKTFVNLPAGKIVDVDGNYLGEHKGLLYYTIGQRKGLNLNINKKKYVVKIDLKNNTLVVGDEKDLLKKEVRLKEKLLLLPGLEQNFGEIYKYFEKIYGKIRYKGQLEEIKDVYENKVIFKNPVRAITPGQHLVLYGKRNGDLVIIGGGQISN